MLVKYNSYDNEQNEKFEHRIVLQSIENTIDMLKKFKEEKISADKREKKLEQLMKEKSQLRQQLYGL